MIEAIFWLFVGVIFLGSFYFWLEERKAARDGKTLIDEVTAYLTKRKGTGE